MCGVVGGGLPSEPRTLILHLQSCCIENGARPHLSPRVWLEWLLPHALGSERCPCGQMDRSTPGSVIDVAGIGLDANMQGTRFLFFPSDPRLPALS